MGIKKEKAIHILGKHAGAPHVHFEIIAPNPNPLKFGKPKVIVNKHVYIK